MALILIPMPFMIVASVMTTVVIGAYFVSTMLVVIRTFFVVTTTLLLVMFATFSLHFAWVFSIFLVLSFLFESDFSIFRQRPAMFSGFV